MQIFPINSLAALHASLSSPAEQREAVFAEQLMAPLRKMWEGWMRFMPRDPSAPAPSPVSLAKGFKFYTPDGDVARGLDGLAQLERAGTWNALVAAMERAARALGPESHGITTLPEVQFTLVLANPDTMDAGFDLYTGVGNVPGTALVICWPTEFNLARLAACAVHELNHNVRFQYEPWTPAVTVGKYLVDEGVAECFAASMYSEEMLGRWTTGHDPRVIDGLRPLYRDALEVSGFLQVRPYMFGDRVAAQWGGGTPIGVPDYAGYATGYQIVKRFLARTGMSAVEATYQPWRRVVDESGYFD